jgi:acyltransferase
MPQSASVSAASPARHTYLDWLRGVAVLIMIGGHTFDSWTLPADRTRPVYGWAVLIFGIGGPLFLFLAGVSVSLAASARAARLRSDATAARTVRRRGWQIFLYAFLFRLQSFVLNPGSPVSTLLKVDILNIMGLAIVAAATLWGAARRTTGRVLALGGATIAVAMLTPLLREMPMLRMLPDPLEWYVRPFPGRTNFTLFPWSGFVTAGAVVGLVLQRAPDPPHHRRAIARITLAGLLLAVGGYGASYLPALYPVVNFWTSSPTFFFLRTGLLLMAVGLAWAWAQRPHAAGRSSPLVLLGVESLFVYWIHVEIVYGVLTTPLHRQLPLPWTVAAFAVCTLLMLGAVVLKRRGQAAWRPRRARAR